MRAPHATVPNALPAAPEQPVPADAEQLRFTLKGIDVDGGTIYSRRDIESASAPLIGREISVVEVFRLANALTARYRRDGYILSQVLVPAQSIQGGHVRLVAVEGFLASVQFRGAIPENDKLLARFARKLQGERPLTAATLERYLLLMNDLGQTSARGTLVPSPQVQGAADLVVDFSRRYKLAAFATDSRNSRSLGPYRATADVDWYAVAGSWDRLSVKTGSSFNRRLNSVGLGYGSTVTGGGLRWNVNVMGVRAHPAPAANLADTDLNTRSLISALQLDYPLLRSRARNLYLHGSLTTFDGRSELVLSEVSDDHIRAVRTGLTFDFADFGRGVNTLDVEYSHGLTALGARDTGTADAPLSRATGRADFSKITWYAARLQSLGGGWTGLLAATGQEAFTTLLAPELFAFGGEPFGRGYDPAEVVGDSGQAVKAELRFSGGRGASWLPAYSVYGFYDRGWIRRRDALNQLAQEQAASCGAGIRLTSAASHWQAFLEVAKPLAHDVAAEGNRRPRVYFGFQVNP
jgi:hemolysin activation/secretion protein